MRNTSSARSQPAPVSNPVPRCAKGPRTPDRLPCGVPDAPPSPAHCTPSTQALDPSAAAGSPAKPAGPAPHAAASTSASLPGGAAAGATPDGRVLGMFKAGGKIKAPSGRAHVHSRMGRQSGATRVVRMALFLLAVLSHAFEFAWESVITTQRL